MKPFNLEEYLKDPNRKIVTRDGRNVTIHCTNYCIKPIIAQIEGLDYSDSFFPMEQLALKAAFHVMIFSLSQKNMKGGLIYTNINLVL